MTRWQVDPSHTSLEFKVKHMMIAKVRGTFSDVEGHLTGEPDQLQHAEIFFKVAVDSINTNNTDRDAHLRSPDFFDVEQFPEMTFQSTSIKAEDEDEFRVDGDLTIHGETQPVSLKVEFEGMATNPQGIQVAAFSMKTKISRKAFGLSWNQALETGGVLVGDEIKIEADLEFNPAE